MPRPFDKTSTPGLMERAIEGLNDAGSRHWQHPWLRINLVLRAMLHERWSAEA